MKGRVNTGGGLNASVILVIAPTGSTVTCVKGDKTKAAVEKNGLWTFRGIENGEWTVKATKDGQSTGQVVDVNQLDVYRVTLAYFNATIETTFPTDCTSVTCKKGATTLSVPNGNLSSGSYTFTIPEPGEWVLYATNGDKEKSITVSVIEEKAYTVTLSFTLYIIKDGKIIDTFTVKKYHGANWTSEDLFMHYSDPGGVYAAIAFNPTIDLTGYNSLILIGENYSSKNNGRLGVLDPSKLSNAELYNQWHKAYVQFAGGTSKNETILNVSEFNEEETLGLYSAAGPDQNVSLRIYELRLE